MTNTDVMLSEIRDMLVDLARQVAKLTAGGPQAGPTVAPDAVLDSKSGDPVVKAKPPRDWSGPSYVGRKHSECPPELLDMMAERLEYFASRADETGEMDAKGEKPKSHWDRRNASICRGWAKRIRAGWKAPAKPTFDDIVDAPDDGDIPFGWVLPLLMTASSLPFLA
jgi:hypothetical protein